MRQTYHSHPCFRVSLIGDHDGDLRLDAIEIEPVQHEPWSGLSRHGNRNFKKTSFRLAQYTLFAALCLAQSLNPMGISRGPSLRGFGVLSEASQVCLFTGR